jgi:tetratricopeptide (TPR) repeat protein
MKNALSMEEKINYVFVRECEIIIDKNLHRISVEEALEEFEKLIALSIPDYKAFIHGVYPFFHEEIMLLMNIGHAYGDLGNRKMAIDIYYMLIRCMNMGYMRREDTVQITVMLISSAARLWGGLGQRDRAIRMSWNAIYKAKRNSLYTVLPKCYGEIAWNMMKQIKDGGRPEKDKKYYL